MKTSESCMERVGIVGAGISGAVIARVLAEAGIASVVFEKRAHTGGNCHTERDTHTGIMLHVYGPHIFHTDDEAVWHFVNRFAHFRPYINRVKALSGGKIYSLPVNLHTINQFFDKAMHPEEAREFVRQRADSSLTHPRNFQEQALSMVGRELYNAFFKGYTSKQWGCDPTELPPEILKRLPLRFTYDDNYFSHRFQGIPEEGYTCMVDRMLAHPLIELRLDTSFEVSKSDRYRHVFWSGALDAYFQYSEGHLGYRTLDFETFRVRGDYQGTAVMNYCDEHIPFTRITEHKHFAPWETHQDSVCYTEFSRECRKEDTPYYPVRRVQEQERLDRYIERADTLQNITFAGRLGTYRYLDMDVSIREALDIASRYLSCQKNQDAMPVFAVNPC